MSRATHDLLVVQVLGMYHPRGYGGYLVDDAVFAPDGQEAFVTCAKKLFSVRKCTGNV